MIQAQQDLLVLEAQNGNTHALECLVIKFHAPLVKFAYNLCDNDALAKDAVQDVWINISKRLHQLDDPRAFKSWLYRAVRWRILDLVKAKAYQYHPLEETSLTVELDESAIEQQQLINAINQLTESERIVVYLHYLSELPVAEIAIVLEIPVGTVKSRLHRARHNLQQHFNQTT